MDAKQEQPKSGEYGPMMRMLNDSPAGSDRAECIKGCAIVCSGNYPCYETCVKMCVGSVPFMDEFRVVRA